MIHDTRQFAAKTVRLSNYSYVKLAFTTLLLCFSPLSLSQESVKLGIVTSLTGRFSEFGRQHQAGFKLALEDIERQNGINGKSLELLLEDDRSSQATALAATEGLLKKEVSLIMGAYSSSITNPLASYLTRQSFPLLVFTSSADGITKPGSDWVFRLNQTSKAYAEVLFDVFDQLRTQGHDLESIVVIHGNGSFETAVADAVKDFALERNYELISSENYDRGITDFRPVLTRFKAEAPDILLMVSYAEDSVALIRQAKEVDLNPKLYAGAAAGFALPNFISGAGDAAEWVISATAWTPDMAHEEAQVLFERLSEELSGPPSYHAVQAYIGVMTAADVLRRAKTLDAEGVRQALLETQLPDTVYGSISFTNEAGFYQQNPLKMMAVQVRSGEFISIYPPLFAKADIAFPTPAWRER